MRYLILFIVLSFGLSDSSLLSRDIHVDPDAGDDALIAGPVKTISRAIRIAKPGDTIHLKPMVYRDYAGFYGVRGEPGKPITLDGHGATLEGSDPLDPAQWYEVKPGLFRGKIRPTMDHGMLGRWFFLWNGKMNHMGRTSKGPSAPFKKIEDLQPYEWTFVEEASEPQTNRMKIVGDFYLKLPPGQKLADANIFVPIRSAGVQFSGSKANHNAHLVIRNLTATHPYNDGFNIHGHCEDVLFENIRAIECGDDGISAHETAEYRVDGFVSIGNSTGICDTGASITSYNRVFIRDCLAFDLYFLDTGRYSVSNSVVLSSAVRPLHVTGRKMHDRPCTLKLDNVYIRRVTNKNEVLVSKYSELDARRVTLLGLDFKATGGKVELHDSLIAEVPALTEISPIYDYFATTAQPRGVLIPEILIVQGSPWGADHNIYNISNLRFENTVYTISDFAEYQKRTGQDTHSRIVKNITPNVKTGANLKKLISLAVPESERHLINSP